MIRTYKITKKNTIEDFLNNNKEILKRFKSLDSDSSAIDCIVKIHNMEQYLKIEFNCDISENRDKDILILLCSIDPFLLISKKLKEKDALRSNDIHFLESIRILLLRQVGVRIYDNLICFDKD